MWQPWVAHWYPRFGPEQMSELSLSDYVAMIEFAKAHSGA